MLKSIDMCMLEACVAIPNDKPDLVMMSQSCYKLTLRRQGWTRKQVGRVIKKLTNARPVDIQVEIGPCHKILLLVDGKTTHP